MTLFLRGSQGDGDLEGAAGHEHPVSDHSVRAGGQHSHTALGAPARPRPGGGMADLDGRKEAAPLGRSGLRPMGLLQEDDVPGLESTHHDGPLGGSPVGMGG